MAASSVFSVLEKHLGPVIASSHPFIILWSRRWRGERVNSWHLSILDLQSVLMMKRFSLLLSSTDNWITIFFFFCAGKEDSSTLV